ncbi:MAG TPA: hypothetical protein VNQ73_02550 [Ilumatobacter sp.]|nr:hypothetical protein [Ilumatobacter sp.]
MRITAVTILADPTMAQLGFTEPKLVRATLADGATADLFTYYSDELHFTEADLIGLTEAEARTLHFRRDVEWLRD